jgi:hypothetical protein
VPRYGVIIPFSASPFGQMALRSAEERSVIKRFSPPSVRVDGRSDLRDGFGSVRSGHRWDNWYSYSELGALTLKVGPSVATDSLKTALGHFLDEVSNLRNS